MVHILKFTTFAITSNRKIRLWKIPTTASGRYSPRNSSYVALGYGWGEWRLSEQHLEETEDITVHLLTEAEVKAQLVNDEIRQSLMAAPLWKYFALKKEN